MQLFLQNCLRPPKVTASLQTRIWALALAADRESRNVNEAGHIVNADDLYDKF